MHFAVVCAACGARFALSDDLFRRKFKDCMVTVRCRHCGADINVDGIELASQPEHEIPALHGSPTPDNATRTPEPTEGTLDLTPTIPLTSPDSSEATWTVSFGDDDDRELDHDQLVHALERKDINANTIVWREGMDEWLPIAVIGELADLLPRATPEADATGGFPGTGMLLDTGAGGAKLKKRAPPLHPSKRGLRRSSSPPRPAVTRPGTEGLFDIDDAETEPTPEVKQRRHSDSFHDLGTGRTSAKVRALSAGTLLIDKKTEPGPRRPSLPRPPKAPIPEWKARQNAAPAAADDDEPPSSGTPALQDLMTLTKRPPEAEPDRVDDAIFAIGDGASALLGPPPLDTGAPTIDPGSPAPAPVGSAAAPASIEVELESEPAPDIRGAERPAAAQPTARGRGATAMWLILVGAATAFSIWWFALRPSRSSPAPPTGASAHASIPAPPAPPVTSTASAAQPEPEPGAGPAESAEPSQNGLAAASTGHAPLRTSHAPSPAHSKPSATAATTHTAGSTHAAAPAATPTGTAQHEPSAKPASKPTKPAGAFDKGAAIATLNAAAATASSCRKQGDPTGMAHVVVTFSSSGRVTTARVNGPPFAGTPTGSCIASHMRRAHVPPFSGDFVTVSKTIVIR